MASSGRPQSEAMDDGVSPKLRVDADRALGKGEGDRIGDACRGSFERKPVAMASSGRPQSEAMDDGVSGKFRAATTAYKRRPAALDQKPQTMAEASCVARATHWRKAPPFEGLERERETGGKGETQWRGRQEESFGEGGREGRDAVAFPAHTSATPNVDTTPAGGPLQFHL